MSRIMEMKKELKKICKNCGKEFIAKGSNRFKRVFCTKKCNNDFQYQKKNQKKVQLLKEKSSTKKNTTNILEIEVLNRVSSEYKLITKYKDLAEKVIRTMRKDKLRKYSQKTQDFCIEIMINLYKFLKEQSEERRIIIAKTDE